MEVSVQIFVGNAEVGGGGVKKLNVHRTRSRVIWSRVAVAQGIHVMRG